MIEFRLHEGRTQYRTWKLYTHNSGSVSARGGGGWVDWTEWKEVPIAEAEDSNDYSYNNVPAKSERTIKIYVCHAVEQKELDEKIKKLKDAEAATLCRFEK